MLVLSVLAAPAAGAVITAGNPVIDQSAGQQWIITMTGDVDPNQNIMTADLVLTIGDGISGDTTTKPAITAATTEQPGFYFENAGSNLVYLYPVMQYGQVYVGNSWGTEHYLSNSETRNLALITFDASAASLGTWEWMLTDTDIGPGAFTVANGTITVTAIPEPRTLAQLLMLAAAGGAGFWFQKRRKLAP